MNFHPAPVFSTGEVKTEGPATQRGRILAGLGVMLWLTAGSAWAAPHSVHVPKKQAPPAPDYSAFYCGGLDFTMPPKWVAVVAETSARAGQWRILPARGATGEEGQLVAFFFGPGKGGGAKETMAAWIGTMFNADGHPAASEIKTRQALSGKISQVVVFGTYSKPVPMAGIPPISKPDYGLIGTVVENPQGNIYWRFTGPEPLVTTNMALFNQMIDSVKPEAK